MENYDDAAVLDYVSIFKDSSVVSYITLFKDAEQCYKLFYHLCFLSCCAENNVLPNGIRIKKPASISSQNEQFYENWNSVILDTERQLLLLLIEEQDRVCRQREKQFWDSLIMLLAKCPDQKVFLDWWIKFSLHFHHSARKLSSKKRMKLRKLCVDVDLSVFEALLESFYFKLDLEHFENSLPEDIDNLVNLLLVGESDSECEQELEEGGKSGEDGKSYVNNSAALEDGRFKGKFVSKKVVNLSGRNLSQSEISLLSKGLKFIPTPKSINMSEIKEDLEKFDRNLKGK